MCQNILFCVIFVFICMPGIWLGDALRGDRRDSGEAIGGKDPIRGMCPPSTFTDTWLYHNETNKCYLADRQGPCGEMMLFYQDPNFPECGYCDCDDTTREDERDEAPDYCNWKRPRLYWHLTDRCYSAFHRGPCKPGQWLVIKNGKPTCELNNCNPDARDEDPDDIYFSFTYRGKCYRTFTYAYCKNKKFIVLNSDESWCPLCSRAPNKKFEISGTRDDPPGVVQVKCPSPSDCNAIQLGCREGRKTHLNLEGVCDDYADYMDWK